MSETIHVSSWVNSLLKLDFFIDGFEALDQRRVCVIEGRVKWVCNQWTFVALEKVYKTVFERLSVAMFHSECVSLVLCPPDEVDRNKIDDGADRHVQLRK